MNSRIIFNITKIIQISVQNAQQCICFLYNVYEVLNID